MRNAIAGISAALILLLAFSVKAEKDQKESKAPMAKTVPKEIEAHGHVRVDNYYWLNQREDPEVLAYLAAENEHTEAAMDHTKPLQNELFNEIKGRIKQDDSSAPYKRGDYFYYTRMEDGKQYPIFCRKRGTLDAPEEIMVDGNALAEGHDYFAVGGLAISYEQNLLAYATDTVGRRIYTIYFKDLDTGELLTDTIPEVTGNMAWANDNRTLFYSKQDLETLRSYRIYRHKLGTDSNNDTLVYEETDETFHTFVFKTKSKRYVMIGSSQTLSDEYRYLDADDPTGEFTVVLPRERGHEHSVDHLGDDFYFLTNDRAENFRLVKAPVAGPTRENWTEVVAHREDVYLDGVELFKDYLAVEERYEGLIRIHISPWNGGESHYLDFGEPAYLAYIGTNPELDTATLRYGYTSMTTPSSVYDYNMKTREKTLIKQEEVLGGFDRSNYETDRLFATADDGARIPISIVYRKGAEKNGKNPLLLYGYGSYGHSLDAGFSSPRLSLIDRGFIYAIAHVRGGQEMGRQWYEQGKLLNKKNTFTDFIACAKYLIAENYTSPEHLYAMGGSAGGLLMGAVLNMAPELFHGAVAAVPFVDVVTTMLDDSIPLTTSEYDEWGNPNVQEYYDYILSYSPYDNVEEKAYPHLLVTTGLHDSQVQYWEPAKWVAKLRAYKTNDTRLLLKTEMEAGHGGPSGRYKRYEDLAFDYAFLLDLEDISE